MENPSKQDQKLLDDIESYGWHVIKVMEDESGPAFGYSVGFYKTFGHPEIIIIGLKLDLIHILINNLGEDIKSGIKFQAGQFYSNILDDFKCLMLDVDKKYYSEYVGSDILYYKGDDFPLMQCVYPTVKGIYPWEENWPSNLKEFQPMLGGFK